MTPKRTAGPFVVDITAGLTPRRLIRDTRGKLLAMLYPQDTQRCDANRFAAVPDLEAALAAVLQWNVGRNVLPAPLRQDIINALAKTNS